MEAFATLIARGPGNASKKVWEQVREFEHIGLRAAKDILRGVPDDVVEEEVITWEAVLTGFGATPADRPSLSAAARERFAEFVATHRGDVDDEYVRTVGGVTFLPVALSTADAREVAAFNGLRVLRPMPRVADLDVLLRGIDPSEPSAPQFPQRQVGEPSVQAKDPALGRVAVFDAGIDPGDSGLRPYVRLHHVTQEKAMAAGVRHGTVVTNAVLYGYAATTSARPRPLVTVDHYRVLPVPQTPGPVDHDYYWILDRIKERVVQDGHQLVNLSLGPSHSVDDDAEPHRWTAELDALAAAHGILFISAVGNNGNTANNRVQTPSDMANGIAVGACTSRDPTAPVTRAAYGAVGPGRAGQRVTPVGMTYGGIDAATPFSGLGPHGKIAKVHGTSYATPLATHGLAGLRAGFALSVRPETMRGFAAHFAEGVPDAGHDERDVGYGRLPESYADVWRCQRNEVSLLYEERLKRHELIMLPFPYPKGVPPEVMVDIVYTICYTSRVQSEHAADYTCAGLETTFRPHERIFDVYDSSTKPKTLIRSKVDIQEDAAFIKRLAKTTSFQWSAHPRALTGKRRSRWEGDQRDSGKWETLVRTTVRQRAKALAGPRLDLEYLARAGSQLIDHNVPELAVTVLVTVRVPPQIALYELVRSQFPVLTELRPAVQIPAALPVRIGTRS